MEKRFDKMSNNINVITQKKELYDKCENMEELYDKYYLPLLEKHYKKTYILEQALDEIEKILNGVGEMACYSKSMYLDGEDIEDIEKIIQKAKGDVK